MARDVYEGIARFIANIAMFKNHKENDTGENCKNHYNCKNRDNRNNHDNHNIFGHTIDFYGLLLSNIDVVDIMFIFVICQFLVLAK